MFRRRQTTLSAISRAVDGVRGRSNVPSHLTSPCTSIGYLISALRRVPVELGPSPRGKFGDDDDDDDDDESRDQTLENDIKRFASPPSIIH